MANKTTFETINIDDFNHDPINQERVQSYPPELVGRFNSFIVTAFDDSMTVEMQLRTLIKWIKENIDVTMSALDNMEAFKQDSMAFQNHVKNTLVNLINQFLDKFDDNLKAETLEILTEWFEDGLLSDLVRDAINEEVINARGGKDSLGERLDESDNQLLNINNEVINARGDNTTLVQRLDKTDTQLAETVKKGELVKNVKDYGIKGDGTTDNSVKLQSLLNLGGHIYFPKGEYLFDKLFINIDDTTLEFSDGVVLKSSYNGDNLRVGSIEIKGSASHTTVVTADIIENTNLVVVSDVSKFSVGDFIKIEQTDPIGTDLASHRQKYLHCVCRINSINTEAKTITVAETIPHDYQVSNNAIVKKINPVKNITILGNNTIFDKVGTTEYANHLYLNMVYNFKISGLKFINGGGKGISLENTHTFYISDIKHETPTNITAGHGYGLQITSGSCYGVIERAYCFNSRHAIDFSNGSNNCIVSKCYAFNSDISGHGQNTKHIKVVDCFTYGKGFGVGNYTFLSDEKWEFINCSAFNVSSNNTAFNIAAQSFDINIIDCSVYNAFIGVTVSGSSNALIKGLKVDYVIGAAIIIQQQSKDIVIEDCFIRGERITSGGGIDITDNSSDIVIRNSDIVTGHRNTIEVRSRSDSSLANVRIDNCRLKTNHSATSKYCIMSEAKGVYVESCQTDSRVQLSHDEGSYKFNNNIVNDWVQIKSTKNTMVIGNFGTPTNWQVPTHNNADIVVANNVTDFV